jgi:phosphohistidine phosphatase SixA
MKRLFLLRHAKAVPSESGVEDFDRTLMLSGMQDAGAMARYLRKSNYCPDLILCSAAARTAQTGELVVQELECEIEYRDSLYLAEPSKILAAVRGAPAAVSALMMVGHNPGLEALVALLAREPVRRKERARHEALEEFHRRCHSGFRCRALARRGAWNGETAGLCEAQGPVRIAPRHA